MPNKYYINYDIGVDAAGNGRTHTNPAKTHTWLRDDVIANEGIEPDSQWLLASGVTMVDNIFCKASGDPRNLKSIRYGTYGGTARAIVDPGATKSYACIMGGNSDIIFKDITFRNGSIATLVSGNVAVDNGKRIISDPPLADAHRADRVTFINCVSDGSVLHGIEWNGDHFRWIGGEVVNAARHAVLLEMGDYPMVIGAKIYNSGRAGANNDDGVDLHAAKHAVVAYNYFTGLLGGSGHAIDTTNFASTASSNPDAIERGSSSYVIGNLFSACQGTAMSSAAGDDGYTVMFGNIATDVDTGIEFKGKDLRERAYALGNWIYKTRERSLRVGTSSLAQEETNDFRMIGNAVWAPISSRFGLFAIQDKPGALSPIRPTLDYNWYWKNSGQSWQLATDTGPSQTTEDRSALSGWQTLTGQEANSVEDLTVTDPHPIDLPSGVTDSVWWPNMRDPQGLPIGYDGKINMPRFVRAMLAGGLGVFHGDTRFDATRELFNALVLPDLSEYLNGDIGIHSAPELFTP